MPAMETARRVHAAALAMDRAQGLRGGERRPRDAVPDDRPRARLAHGLPARGKQGLTTRGRARSLLLYSVLPDDLCILRALACDEGAEGFRRGDVRLDAERRQLPKQVRVPDRI